MDALAIDTSPAPTIPIERSSRASSTLTDTQRAFSQVLGKALPEPKGISAEARSREIAEQVVTISLVQPLLKQLRETSNAAPPFAPTQAEKQFRALTDAALAQNIVKAKQFSIVDRMAAMIEARAGRLASGRTIQQELAGARAAVPQNPSSGVNIIAR